jgi:hypothetical protein
MKGRALSGEDKLRARAVRQRKEALRYGVERLELEVLQKERELRKRLDSWKRVCATLAYEFLWVLAEKKTIHAVANLWEVGTDSC